VESSVSQEGGPVLRVLTLGGLTIEAGSPAPGAANARLQGMGLLARLAVAGDRGVSREKLIGCFWPEKDERQALHSLSQALHRLRVDLGRDGIVVGTRILKLDPAHVSSDVGDFEASHRARDAQRMVELYAGPFLDGVYFASSPEFERWVDTERQRLAGLYAAALRSMATRATVANAHDEASGWWRQLVAIDPLDATATLGLLRSLVASGDREAALHEARMHQALVRSELRREPDPRIESFLHAATAADAAPPPEPGVTLRTADALCARARQCLYQFTRAGFADAIRWAERAVEVDPSHAESHTTLASTWIALSQGERMGDPRARGIEYCRRAMALDPTLGEPVLWYAWALQLDERFEEAEAMALRGLALDPEGVFSHSALGWVRLAWGLRTGRWSKCVDSIGPLARALTIHPREPHMPLALATLYMLDGRYDVAGPLLERTIAVESSTAAEMRTIGARALHGVQLWRSGRTADAQAALEDAMAVYGPAPQIYAPYVNGLTRSALGDLHRMRGENDEALHHYAGALALADRMPDLIGCGMLAVRLELRLAVVYRLLRMRSEEGRHARRAAELTAARAPYSFNWCWGVSDAEMHYDWAIYHATRGDRDAMLVALRHAIAFGWREVTLLETEPAFAFARGDRALESVAAEALRRPPLPEPGVATAVAPPAATPH
jgi:DNA-binding SARP family transcriptional activator/tetratricopeptide (TPR) repeat protein